MLNVNATALESAALGGPIDEPFHLIAVFPHQTEKFGGIEGRGFRSEKRLKPPAKVRASPWIQAIPASDDPVVTQHLPHLGLRIQASACTSSKTASLPSGLRGAHAREASLHRASPKCRYSGPVLLYFCRLLFFRKNAWRRWSTPACRDE